MAHVSSVTNMTFSTGIAHVPQHTHYQNREVRNAVSVMPHNQFVAHRTVVVSAAPERINPHRILESAPVSAVAPASIAHPNGFPHASNREQHARPEHAATPGQPNRLIQPVQPTIRESAPPTVRLPRHQDANERVMRHADVQIERRTVAPAVAAPTPRLMTPPSPQPPAIGHPDFGRRHEIHTDRHIEPPNILHPEKETPRIVPQPNPALEAQRRAEAQARALKQQQNAVQAPMPLKQAVPPAGAPGQEERRHRWQENGSTEMRRDDRRDAVRDGFEGRRRP
jgi:hypothetical protein